MDPRTVIRWFRSVCQNLVSPSLKIQLFELPQENESFTKIEDILLTVSANTMSLNIYLDIYYEDRFTMFPKLYEAGIVSEWREQR